MSLKKYSGFMPHGIMYESLGYPLCIYISKMMNKGPGKPGLRVINLSDWLLFVFCLFVCLLYCIVYFVGPFKSFPGCDSKTGSCQLYLSEGKNWLFLKQTLDSEAMLVTDPTRVNSTIMQNTHISNPPNILIKSMQLKTK